MLYIVSALTFERNPRPALRSIYFMSVKGWRSGCNFNSSLIGAFRVQASTAATNAVDRHRAWDNRLFKNTNLEGVVNAGLLTGGNMVKRLIDDGGTNARKA